MPNTLLLKIPKTEKVLNKILKKIEKMYFSFLSKLTSYLRCITNLSLKRKLYFRISLQLWSLETK